MRVTTEQYQAYFWLATVVRGGTLRGRFFHSSSVARLWAFAHRCAGWHVIGVQYLPIRYRMEYDDETLTYDDDGDDT